MLISFIVFHWDSPSWEAVGISDGRALHTQFSVIYRTRNPWTNLKQEKMYERHVRREFRDEIYFYIIP